MAYISTIRYWVNWVRSFAASVNREQLVGSLKIDESTHWSSTSRNPITSPRIVPRYWKKSIACARKRRRRDSSQLGSSATPYQLASQSRSTAGAPRTSKSASTPAILPSRAVKNPSTLARNRSRNDAEVGSSL